MKKIIQAAALILMTAVVVYAAARSHHPGTVECRQEWKSVYHNTIPGLADDSNLLSTGKR